MKKFPLSLLFISLIFGSEIKETAEQAQVEKLGSAINTRYVEYTPYVTDNEEFLFFESNRPGGRGSFDLWYAESTVNKEGRRVFKPAVNMGAPVNTATFDGLPSLRRLADGSFEMYFTSKANGERPGPAKTNIYYTRQLKGQWQVPTLVQELSSEYDDRMATISPDGQTIFFTSNRPGGFGDDDIYVARYNAVEKKFSAPRNIGPVINTRYSEASPSIHRDGVTLYFSSNRPEGEGGYDIFFARLPAGAEKIPREGSVMNLGAPYNSAEDDEYPTVTRDGLNIYFASNRLESEGGYDIFRARLPAFGRPEVFVTVKGRVQDVVSGEGLQARFSFHSGAKNMVDGSARGGSYDLGLKAGQRYLVRVEAEGYQPQQHVFDLRNEEEPRTISKNFLLLKKQLDLDLSLKFVFTGENQQTLKPLVVFQLVPGESEPRFLYHDGSGFSIKRKLTSLEAEKIKTTRVAVSAALAGYEPVNFYQPLADALAQTGPLEISMVKKWQPGQAKPIERVTGTDLSRQFVTAVYFGTAEAVLSNNEKARVQEMVSSLKASLHATHSHIYLFGHTDTRDSAAYNMRLSKQRSLHVKQLLVNEGIKSSSIKAYWLGDRMPIVKETSARKRLLNRRVNIYLVRE